MFPFKSPVKENSQTKEPNPKNTGERRWLQFLAWKMGSYIRAGLDQPRIKGSASNTTKKKRNFLLGIQSSLSLCLVFVFLLSDFMSTFFLLLCVISNKCLTK